MIEANTSRDWLSHREKAVYKTLHALGLASAVLGISWFFLLRLSEPSYLHAIIFSISCLPVAVFGYALRTDTRVIYGISWLRKQ